MLDLLATHLKMQEHGEHVAIYNGLIYDVPVMTYLASPPAIMSSAGTSTYFRCRVVVSLLATVGINNKVSFLEKHGTSS